MRLLPFSAALILGISAAYQVFAADSCIDVLADRPTSSAARVCATKQLAIEQKKLKQLEREIELALLENAGLALNKVTFRKAQQDWKAYIASNCWLESFQIGESTAMQLACEARMTTCRTENLKGLLASVKGEEGEFSATKPCQ